MNECLKITHRDENYSTHDMFFHITGHDVKIRQYPIIPRNMPTHNLMSWFAFVTLLLFRKLAF